MQRPRRDNPAQGRGRRGQPPVTGPRPLQGLIRRGQPSAAGAQPPIRRRRISRREREARRRRILYWGMGILGAMIVVILAAGYLIENVITPRQVVASIGGTEIRRKDYWKFRSVELVQQADEFEQLAFSGLIGTDQQQQYLQFSARARQEAEQVWGSTDLEELTLSRMIDGQVYLQNLDDLGLSIDDDQVETYVLRQFQPVDAPLTTATPTPTFIPARAAMATETAAALAATPIASPIASPVAAVTEDAESGSPGASPVASPGASPVASPAAPPTPNPEEALATAAAGYDLFAETVLDDLRVSRDDYVELIARPDVARNAVQDAIAAQVGQSADQAHAAHILVETRDLADQLYEQVTQPDADFGAIAREQSVDSATAGNGGDLGWFTPEEMVEPFAEVAFSLEPGRISEPFETEFGWHIVHLIERADDRPLNEAQIAAIEQARVDAWLEEQKEETAIESDLGPTPTPFPAQFEPPVDAPPAPTPTPAPIATPAIGLPAASPVAAP